MKKFLLNTFDYELFLGSKSGLPMECMIEPTNNLLSVLEEYGVKAIFFVDTAYLFRLKQNAINYPASAADYAQIKEQLQSLISKGHYLFPHIHPHWLDAKYLPDQNQWELINVKRYRFHNTTTDERKLLFDVSFKILEEIIYPVKPDYKINAYRAGGWSLQPFEDYKPFFEQYGIQYDFTVMPGLFQFSNAQYFDFTRNPGKLVYKFDNDVSQEEAAGSFTEVTSTVLQIPSYINSINKFHLIMLHRLINDHTFGRGEGQKSVNDESAKPFVQNMNGSAKYHKEVASLELLSIVKLKTYLRYFNQHNYMQFVSHPKMLSKHNLITFKKFLKTIYKKYEVETDCEKIIKQLQPGSSTTNIKLT